MAHDWRAVLAAIALAATTASASGTQEFQVIAHPSVQGVRITRANLSALSRAGPPNGATRPR